MADLGLTAVAATTVLGNTAVSSAAVTALGASVGAASTFTLSSLMTGASLAWSIGSTLFSMFQGANQSITGPRLKDLHVQSAAFGTPMKRFWGIDRMAGELIWIGSDGKGGRGIREHARKKKLGGKGKGGGTATTFTYDADFAIAINAASNCQGVITIWCGSKKIYDASKDRSLQTIMGSAQQLNTSGSGTVTFYDGNEDQQPPPLIEALSGVGNTSAYRNQFLAVFQNFDLTKYGPIPSFSFECFTDGDEEFAEKEFYALNAFGAPGYVARQTSWSHVDPNGEIVALIGVQGSRFSSVDPTTGEPLNRMVRLLSDGSVIPEEMPAVVMADASDTTTASQIGGIFITGVSDEHMMVTSADVGAVIIRPGEAMVTLALPTGLPGYSGIPFSFFAKKDEAIYLGGDGGWRYGLAKFNSESGQFLAATETVSDLYQFGYLKMVCVGDDYVWGLNVQGSGETLIKIDPDTLEVVDSIYLGDHFDTISGAGNIEVMYVENDSLIHFQGRTSDGRASFYEYRDDVLTLLGHTASPSATGNHNGTLFVRNGVRYTGNFGYWGFYDIPIHAWAPGNEGFCCPLWKIQRDICLACGMEESDIDVSELTDCVQGYTLDQQMTGRDATLPLQRYAFYDGRESDLILQFPKRGKASVATIPEADMAARPSLDAPLPDLIAQTRAAETELPVRVHCRFKDQDATYQTGHAYSSRLTSESKHTVTVDIPIVMTASKAKQITDVLMRTDWLERAPKEVLVSRRYLRLDAADPVTLEVAA